MNTRVRRRPSRKEATVVVTDVSAFVEGVDVDVVQLVALSAGLAHDWDRVASRWAFADSDALPLAAALRAANHTVCLASRAAS